MVNRGDSEAARLAEALREPVHAVGGLTDVLASMVTEPSIEAIVASISTETARMATILDDLLRALRSEVELAEAPSRPSPTPTPILVVDDSPVNRLLTESQLTKLGYASAVVASGPDALEYLAANSVALILMDWHMPVLDGLETAATIRQNEEASGEGRVPIIALTARAMDGDRETCLAAGMDDFLSKPVGIQALGDAIARWIDDGVVTPAAEPPTRPTVQGEAENAGIEGSDLDHRVLDRLADELGDPAMVDTLLRTYLVELPGRLEALTSAASEGDTDAIRSVTHTLKSTSEMFGASRLAAAARAVEHAAANDENVGQLEVEELVALADAVSESMTLRLQSAGDEPG